MKAIMKRTIIFCFDQNNKNLLKIKEIKRVFFDSQTPRIIDQTRVRCVS